MVSHDPKESRTKLKFFYRGGQGENVRVQLREWIAKDDPIVTAWSHKVDPAGHDHILVEYHDPPKEKEPEPPLMGL